MFRCLGSYRIIELNKYHGDFLQSLQTNNLDLQDFKHYIFTKEILGIIVIALVLVVWKLLCMWAAILCDVFLNQY